MTGSGHSVAVIIPAFNEAKRVGFVVSIAKSCGLFAEIVVVDDGGTDGTADVAEAAGADVIRHENNRGKPAAMLSGLQSVSADVICFLDADLVSFNDKHLELLIGPVLRGETRAAIAVFSGGRSATTLAQKIAPMISGQRCLRRELLDKFTGWDSGFGIETAINDYLRKLGVHQKIVSWHGASHVMKEEKRGWFRGFGARLLMYWQILVTWLRSRTNRS